jgi:hypothetical protein
MTTAIEGSAAGTAMERQQPVTTNQGKNVGRSAAPRFYSLLRASRTVGENTATSLAFSTGVLTNRCYYSRGGWFAVCCSCPQNTKALFSKLK